ncbi:hypothetical protein ACQRD6_11505, partial [Prevotella sp. SGI.027]
LKVKYTVSDAKNTVMTITKSYKSHAFGANKICDIPVNLGVRHYSGHNYYMWDARENYWSGHEWDSADPWQPTVNYESNDGYPKSKTADGARWYNEGSGAFEASVNPLFKQLPNANEMGWYILKGDAHWDDSTWWELFGGLHIGGIWLKKLSVIAQENGKEPAALKQADPSDRNLLTSTSLDRYSIAPKKGKPADSMIGNYFFLPALGYCDIGELALLGKVGDYWSSSAYPGNIDNISRAYSLSFSSNYSYFVGLYNGSYRSHGFVAQPFE